MSTGTSNGEPSSCPPSSWNCTSSRCTSSPAASSCANKSGRRQPHRGDGKAPTSASLRPRGPGAGARPAAAPRPPFTHTHRYRGCHPASPRAGGRLQRDGAPLPWSGGATVWDIALWCCGGEVSRRAGPRALGVGSRSYPSPRPPLGLVVAATFVPSQFLAGYKQPFVSSEQGFSSTL